MTFLWRKPAVSWRASPARWRRPHLLSRITSWTRSGGLHGLILPNSRPCPSLKRRSAFAVIAALALALTALGASAYAQSSGGKTLKVGVRGGVDEEIWEVVTQEAAKMAWRSRPVVITGTASPNEALNNGDLEANSFQHIPFLNDQIQVSAATSSSAWATR